MGYFPLALLRVIRVILLWFLFCLFEASVVEGGERALNLLPTSLPPSSPSTLAYFGRFWIRLYQRWITPANGATCNFYPTCSAYALEALERYGFLGIFMAAERMMRDHHPRPDDLPIIVHGRIRYDDPVFSHAPQPFPRKKPFRLITP